MRRPPRSHHASRQLEMLRILAAGLGRDAEFAIAMQGEGWSWSPQERLLRVSERDLHCYPTPSCEALVAHEMGHALISRYHLAMRWAIGCFPHPLLGEHTLNALEDVRVNAFMARRYPGSTSWLGSLAASRPGLPTPFQPSCLAFLQLATLEGLPPFLDAISDPRALAQLQQSRYQEIGASEEGQPEACEHRRLDREAEDSFGDEVIRALRQTADARRRFATGFLPASSLDLDGVPKTLGALLEREVYPCLYRRRAPPSLTPFEGYLALLAVRSVKLLHEEILPAITALWEQDVSRIAAFLTRNRKAVQMARLIADGRRGYEIGRLIDAVMSAPLCSSPRPDEALRGLSVELLGAYLGGIFGQQDSEPAEPCGPETPPDGVRPGPCPLRPERGEAGALDDSMDGRSEEEYASYDHMAGEVAGQVDVLVQRLREILSARARLRERCGYSNGGRVHLRSAMAAESDPRRLETVWMRKTVPDRRRAVFSLLVDLSGSMRDDKIRAACHATVLLTETLNRLGIAFEVNGFQDRLIPVAGFDEALNNEVRSRIERIPLEVQGRCPGGNNHPVFNDDGPCLLEAGWRLLEQPGEDRVLLVISDGLPEGRHSGSRDLVAAIAGLSHARSGITLIGMGIGPGTGHVNEFYPWAVGELPVSQFAEGMAQVLETAIRRLERA